MRTLERIVSSEAEICKESETAASLSRKRIRDGKNGDVKEAIGTWFTTVLNKGPMIKHKTEHFAQYLGSDSSER